MRVLFSALSSSPEFLFSAIVIIKPEHLLIITEKQSEPNLRKVLEAATEYHSPQFVKAFILSDPSTPSREARVLARDLVQFADEDNVVNMAGGTPAMQDCLSSLTHLIACRQIAILDHHSRGAREGSPFAVGDMIELEPEQTAEHIHVRLQMDSLANKARSEGLNIQILEKAFCFAESRHGNQQRDCGTLYLGHPVRVCASLYLEFEVRDSELLAAGLLHDVLEDTVTTYDELVDQFGNHVAKTVGILTKLKGSGSEEKEEIDRKYIDQFRNADDTLKGACLLKLADRLDNIRSLRFDPREDKRRRYVANTKELYLPLAREISSYATVAIENAMSLL